MYETSAEVVEHAGELEMDGNYGEKGTETDEIEREEQYISPFAKWYKSKTFLTQEERRIEFLERLKQDRYEVVDKMRSLMDFLSDQFEDCAVEEPMDVQMAQAARRKKRKFHHKLMMSEWMTEKPSDFEEEWVVKLCPIGQRHLVVANRKVAQAYTRKGKYVQSFYSHLPGGNFLSGNGSSFTILDCVFNFDKCCYFVLDVLAWNSYSLKHVDVKCRLQWLESKFYDTPELAISDSNNQFPFHLVDAFPTELLGEKLSVPYKNNYYDGIDLDGILFYRKEVPYLNGLTPLVGWLKGYMVKEILNIDVHESYQEKAPSEYTTLKEHLEEKRRSWTQKKNVSTSSAAT